MTRIQPFGDRVVVEILQPEEKLAGGLLIACTSKEKSNRGVVVAIGESEELKNINVGDKIIFNLSAGLNYSSEEGDYKVLQIRDIIGKIVEE